MTNQKMPGRDKLEQVILELEERGLIQRTGEIYNGGPVYVPTQPGGLSVVDLMNAAVCGPLVAINVPWPDTVSGLVEWRLVGWTEAGARLPILTDHDGDAAAWGSDFAIQGPDGRWTFPDGESCAGSELAAAFARRKVRH